MQELRIYYGYIKTNTIDANLHPDLQIKALLEYIRKSTDSVIEIYCNSPYVLFNITLIEAYCDKKIAEKNNPYFDISVTNKHYEVLENGDIVEGKYYKNMISDENLLNDKLGEANDNFSKLLELEDEK